MSTAAIRLGEYGLLAVEGARALPFLQGQLTCNVQDASAESAIPGAYCTPKGRVIASFLLWARSPECVLLRMRADILAATAAVLGKYAALSRVRVSTAGIECIGVLGDGARDALGGVLGAWPLSPGAVALEGELAVVRRDEAGERVELWAPRSIGDALWDSLRSRAPVATAERWRLALVRAGEAEVQLATVDRFLPQMLGYDTSGAVSFRKGCYTGQEVIARTHYKGSVKRRLHRLGGSGGGCPAAGAELQLGATGRAAGTVVESAGTTENGFELLAVLADEALTSGACTARTAQGAPLEVLPLPCAIL